MHCQCDTSSLHIAHSRSTNDIMQYHITRLATAYIQYFTKCASYAFILYSLLISDEDYCDKPVGANTTGTIKIYTLCKYVDPGVPIF